MGGDYTGLPLPFTPRCELPLDPTQSLIEENRKFRGLPKKEKSSYSPGNRKKIGGQVSRQQRPARPSLRLALLPFRSRWLSQPRTSTFSARAQSATSATQTRPSLPGARQTDAVERSGHRDRTAQ